MTDFTKIKKLPVSGLADVCAQMRDIITNAVEKNGGHLASNLGIVEVTTALHYVFDPYFDRIVFDVGHQCYAHKILTGRSEGFENLRKDEGVTGFPNTHESDADVVTSGHASAALSIAAGLAKARDLNNDSYNVIAVVGDGALSGGMAFEALNDIGAANSRVIIILNDNRMSISKNVGALSIHLSKLRLSRGYVKLKRDVKRALQAFPLVGDALISAADSAKAATRHMLVADKMFEQLGIKYYGPLDGHNLPELISTFRRVRDYKGAVLVHLVTQKGKGSELAEKNPEAYHGIYYSEKNGENAVSFSKTAGDCLIELASCDSRVTAITAAMAHGTGLNEFAERFESRFFDVGIAEQHAVTMAAGLAKGGMRPFFAVYSTFLQRAYDQILHDVCLNNLPVTFLVDRAGISGADGVTHQGVFDLSYLSTIPNLAIAAPSDANELREMMRFALKYNAPLAIRYPKSCSIDINSDKNFPAYQFVRKNGSGAVVFAVGSRMIELALNHSKHDVVSARFVCPLDENMLDFCCKNYSKIITAEDNIISGGFGDAVSRFLNTRGYKKIQHELLAYPVEFIYSLDLSKSLDKYFISRLEK